MLLTKAIPNSKTLTNSSAAKTYVSQLALNAEQLISILNALDIPNKSSMVHDTLVKLLINALSQGNVIVVEHENQNTPQKEKEQTVAETGTGNKTATLGPHAGLHNQEWDSVKVEDDSFKTVKQVDMAGLSEDEKLAKDELLDQGWDKKKIKQVIKSGDDFKMKELQKGDKLYGFDTKGREKNIKTSAYWLGEEGFQAVKADYFKNGKWDNEGVKNNLALPCFNRASDITTVEVTQKTTVVESKVGKARELIQYTDKDGYTTGTLGKIMGGGGTQITANPTVLKKL